MTPRQQIKNYTDYSLSWRFIKKCKITIYPRVVLKTKQHLTKQPRNIKIWTLLCSLNSNREKGLEEVSSDMLHIAVLYATHSDMAFLCSVNIFPKFDAISAITIIYLYFCLYSYPLKSWICTVTGSFWWYHINRGFLCKWCHCLRYHTNTFG